MITLIMFQFRVNQVRPRGGIEILTLDIDLTLILSIYFMLLSYGSDIVNNDIIMLNTTSQ